MSYSQYTQYSQNPYSNGPDAEAGYGNNLNAPGAHELNSYSNDSQYSNADVAAQHNTLSQQAFLERVDFCKAEIRTLSANIQSIATLHQRALASPDSSSSAQLEDLVVQTQLKNTQIKDQIKYLELDAVKTSDSTKGIKSTQANKLKAEFERSLQDYRREELNYRSAYKEQIARQYRIVNPDATEAEVTEASELDWGSEGVFQTALKSNRSGQASSVLGAVRARHNELQRIEATLTDLAALFADMAQIVEAQEPVVEHTEENAIKTADHVDKANDQIDIANKHARNRNKLKWYCLLVVVIIIIAIALGVGLGVALTK